MLWIIGASALCLGCCLPLFVIYKRSLQLPLACAFKALGTLCALILALVAAIRLDPGCYIVVIALALHLLGDIALEYHFLLGMGFFMAGHIAYISFFLRLWPVSVLHVVLLLAFLAITAYILYQWRKPAGKQMPLFSVYAAVLCVMCACALGGGFSSYTLPGILIGIGTAMFYVSDALILRRTLFPAPKSLEWPIMILYYGAQLLFGASCLLL